MKRHSPLAYDRVLKGLSIVAAVLVFLVVVAVSFPAVLAYDIAHERSSTAEMVDFPVTVDPKNKQIVENTQVNAFLESSSSPLQAAAASSNVAWRIFEWIATTISNASWYQGLAAANSHLVTITPGMRKEQVASAFASAMRWNSTQKKAFTTTGPYASLPLTEGSYAPGTYVVPGTATPAIAQSLVNERFTDDVLSHYSTSTASIVPLSQALTIASLIEREAGGPEDMRLISGIIWNRLFLGMNLQIDATLQYVRANATRGSSWWPTPQPTDRSRKSAYNTYLHAGLPPTPIANPSVAAVIAALNPKSTPCLFYFHDKAGVMHCSETYAEHVRLLKKYYGQGK